MDVENAAPFVMYSVEIQQSIEYLSLTRKGTFSGFTQTVGWDEPGSHWRGRYELLNGVLTLHSETGLSIEAEVTRAVRWILGTSSQPISFRVLRVESKEFLVPVDKWPVQVADCSASSVLTGVMRDYLRRDLASDGELKTWCNE